MHALMGCDPASTTREKLRAIAAEIFEVDVKHIDLAMSPDDIDRWDSLNHLRLITEVENTFTVRLTMQQIQRINSLNDIAVIVSAVRD